jgi:phage terminase large subunit-like protein
MAVDPATGKTDIGSETSITVLGQDKTINREYVLESIAGIWDPVERRRQIQASNERWHPRKIFVEDVGAQADLVSELKVLDLPAFGLSTEGKDKIARIDTLCVPIEAGVIHFHLSQQELVHQLINFPGGRRLDRADSLEIAHRSFRTGVRTFRRCL